MSASSLEATQSDLSSCFIINNRFQVLASVFMYAFLFALRV